MQLVYGSLGTDGRLQRSRPYVIVSEAPSPSLAFAYMWGFARGVTPTTDELYFQPANGIDGLAVGLMSVSGKAITVEAPTDDLVLAAAQALHPVGG